MSYEFTDTPGGLILHCETAVNDGDAERAEDLGMKAGHKWVKFAINLSVSPPISWEESAVIDHCTQIETDAVTVCVRIPYDEFDAAYMRHVKALAAPGVN
jgi:hypothetical protein